MNATLLSLGQSIEGVSEQANLVLADMNNDSLVDFVLGGNNGTEVLKVYIGNSILFSFNESISGGVTRGSLDLVDYDKDGDLDVVEVGLGVQNYESRIFKKD